MKAKHILLLALPVLFLILTGIGNSLKAQKPTGEKEVTIWASMTCESCKKKIERDIAFEKGVKDITVDLSKKTVTIKYKAEKNSDDKLLKAVEKLGFEAKIVKPETKK